MTNGDRRDIISDIQMPPQKHLHWSFLAYNKPQKVIEGKLSVVDATEVTVTDDPIEAAALERVKKIVQRKHYLLRRVWECEECFIHSANQKQMERITEFLKRAGGFFDIST